MSLPIDQYESLRQRVCPEEAIKPQLLDLQSLDESNTSGAHQTYHLFEFFRNYLEYWQSFHSLKETHCARLNHKDWRNEKISEKLGIITGICGKARAKVRQQFLRMNSDVYDDICVYIIYIYIIYTVY